MTVLELSQPSPDMVNRPQPGTRSGITMLRLHVAANICRRWMLGKDDNEGFTLFSELHLMV
jgi:hypothetical protein